MDPEVDLAVEQRMARARISEAERDLLRKVRPGGGEGRRGRKAWFRVVSRGDEVIYCRTWNGSVAGEDLIPLAKPWDLRMSVTARNSITYGYTTESERVATYSGGTETQVVVQAYAENDVILAVCLPSGTLVSPVAVPGVSGTVPVDWQDLNLAGRRWAKKDGT